MAFLLGLMTLLVVARSQGKVWLYLSSDQTEQLYGIKTDGLYYVRDGMVNQYAMTFQHQVIPAEVDHIDFTWRASPHTAVPYKMTFIHTPGPAMDQPTVNVSVAGLVPTYPDKFRLYFPCTGRINAEVDTLLQVSLSLGPGEPEVLSFKRRKVCKEKEKGQPAEGLVSSPSAPASDNQSVLLASVSPTMFVAMGAASASVLLFSVLLAALYLRRMRKRTSNHQLGSSSLRSSLHLHSELEYTEKLTGSSNNGTAGQPGCDSYATLASFTKVPVHRPEAPGWARFSSPSVADYSIPLARSSPRPSINAHCSPSPRRPFGGSGGTTSSLGSLQSTSLVYDTNCSRSRVVAAAPPPLTNRHHFAPAPPRYTNCDSSRMRLPPPPHPPPPFYPDYEYTAPNGGECMAGSGEASPYSVSSELYKHVLPQQYFPLTSGDRSGSRGSVLV